MTYRFKARFEKAFKRLDPPERERVTEAVEQLQRFFETRHAPEGLGIKKLFSRERLGAIFEARASIAVRILFSVEHDAVTYLMVGDHDEVRRFIRSFQ
jgi:mRNA-degrading endonuclease RelE of RelBE toxin-antitoxin system